GQRGSPTSNSAIAPGQATHAARTHWSSTSASCHDRGYVSPDGVRTEVPMSLQPLLESVLGTDLPVRVETYDGSAVGPVDAPAKVVIRRPEAMHRILTGLGRELAFARAFVAGEIDIEGDIYAVLELRDHMGSMSVNPTLL